MACSPFSTHLLDHILDVAARDLEYGQIRVSFIFQ